MAQDAQILFHAGTQKTGTTSIQNALAHDRSRLAQKGILYPLDKKRPEAHHRFVKHALRTDLAAKAQVAIRKMGYTRALAAGQRLVFSAEPAYRAVLNEKAEPGSRAWFESHAAALRKLRHSLGHAPAAALLVFRRPEVFATSLHKEYIAQWNAASPLQDLAGQSADRLHFFLYAQQIKAFEAAFDQVATLGYESACASAGGVLGRFYDWLDVPPPATLKAPLRRSLSNPAVRWLRRASRATDAAGYRTRVLFAVHSGAPCLIEAEPSTLWPSADHYDRFVESISESYDLPFVAPPAPLRLPYTPWSDAQHEEAERAFALWAEQNSAALVRRQTQKTAYYHPLASS